MIASHLLAYFFTELNHDQVQKVSQQSGAAGSLLTKLRGPRDLLLGPDGIRFLSIQSQVRRKSPGC